MVSRSLHDQSTPMLVKDCLYVLDVRCRIHSRSLACGIIPQMTEVWMSRLVRKVVMKLLVAGHQAAQPRRLQLHRLSCRRGLHLYELHASTDRPWDESK